MTGETKCYFGLFLKIREIKQNFLITVRYIQILLKKCMCPLTQGAKSFVLFNQYCAGNKIETNEMGWACGTYGLGEGGVNGLGGKTGGNRPLGRPGRRWVDNIRMGLQEVGCGYMDWIGLAQDRDRWRTLVSAVTNLRVP